MASRTVFRIERGPTGQIRRPDGRQGRGIGDEQLSSQGMRLSGHDRRVLFGGDRRLERPGLDDQCRLSRVGWKGRDPLAHLGRELVHFRVFGRTDDLAVLDGAAVVHREIVEQTPRGL